MSLLFFVSKQARLAECGMHVRVMKLNAFKDKPEASMWYYAVIVCGFRMTLSENRPGRFLRCYFAECMSCGIIVDESG